MKIMRFGAGIALILFIGVLGTLFVSCPKLGDDSGKVTGVDVTPKAETVDEKQSVQLTATVSGEGTYDKTVTWASKAQAIATVDQNGKVTGIAPGTAKITATSNGDNTIFGEATITVEAAESEAAVSKVEITSDVTKVGIHGTITLKAVVTGGKGEGVTWSSGKPEIASVDQNGVVTGNKVGIVAITAKSKEDANMLDSVEITVSPPPVSKVEITSDVTKVGIRGTITLKAVVTGGKGEGVTWSSGKPEIASVDQEGKVTGNKPGSVTITAISKEDASQSASVEITVLPPVSKVEITADVTKIGILGKITLKAEVTGGSGEGVTWSSSHPEIASVDENGVVTGKKLGDVTITAKSKEDVSKSASVEITVEATPVRFLIITADAKEVGIRGKITLKALITGGRGEGVTWSSNNSSTASVDENGVVTGNKVGNATITATSNEDPTKKNIVTITVTSSITKFSIKDPKRKAILIGQKFQFELDATGGSGLGATWSISSAYHTIDEDSGLLTTGKVAGSLFTITATSKEDPGLTDTIERFCVLEKAPSITIEESGGSAGAQTAYLEPGQNVLLLGTVSGFISTDDKTWSYKYDETKLDDSSWVSLVVEPYYDRFIIVHDTYSKLEENVQITVTASSDEYPESKATFTVNLVPAGSATIKEVTITPGAPTIVEKEGVQLKAIVTGDGTFIDQAVTWKSMDTEIATVDQNGKVTGVAPGEVKIIATSKRKGSVSGEATITVKVASSVSNVKITSDVTEVGVRDTITLKAEVEGGEDKGVSWSSSNPEIASVNQYGVVTGIKIGSVTITAKSKEDASKSASKEITVRIGGRLTVSTGATTQLVAIDGDTPKATWSSSDPDTATVDENGVVKGLKPGEVEITAKYVEDGTTLSYKVTVNVVGSITAFSIKDPKRKAILFGQKFLFELDVTGGSDLGATWSTDSTVHTIDKDSGLLTAGSSVDHGLTITATSKENPELTDTIEFTILEKAPSVTITNNSDGTQLNTVQLKPGDNILLSGRVIGDVDDTKTWSYEYDDTKLGDSSWVTLSEFGLQFFVAHSGASKQTENVPITVTATSVDYPESKATVTIILVPASSSE